MTRCKINNEEMVIKGIDEVPMFSWNTETKEFYVLGHKFDGVNSIEDFVNFINNLQEENRKLKEQYCERTDCGGRIGNSKKVEELIKENERLEEENFNLREGIYIEKMSFPSEGRNFKELIEMPTYDELLKENEKLNHYKLLYQKVKERNTEAIEYVNKHIYQETFTGYMDSYELRKLLDILEGNNENM